MSDARQLDVGDEGMAGIIDFVPDADSFLALGTEDLGLILLKLIQSDRSQSIAPSSLEMPLWNTNNPGYPYTKKKFVSRAFAEAWQWLQNEGLLMYDPDQTKDWFCLTRKGAKLKATDVDAYRRGNVLPVGLLHPRLAEKVRPMFLRGDYEVAVLQAFIEVEVAVRDASGLTKDVIGKDLMLRAFNKDRGPLTDIEAVVGEREGIMFLFAGAIGHCKNPPSHRKVDIAPVTAARLITLASHLLSWVETMAGLKELGLLEPHSPGLAGAVDD
jgi:uncharacterized protein (TIGR02391 family)